MTDPTVYWEKQLCSSDSGIYLNFNFAKEKLTELSFVDWPTLEGRCIA